MQTSGHMYVSVGTPKGSNKEIVLGAFFAEIRLSYHTKRDRSVYGTQPVPEILRKCFSGRVIWTGREGGSFSGISGMVVPRLTLCSLEECFEHATNTTLTLPPRRPRPTTTGARMTNSKSVHDQGCGHPETDFAAHRHSRSNITWFFHPHMARITVIDLLPHKLHDQCRNRKSAARS